MKKEISFNFIIAVLVALIVWFSFYLGLFSGLENFFEDLLFSPRPVQNSIVIVSIDSESIQKIGQWPWPREVFARAFDILNENPPAVVGLDVIFSEKSRAGDFDDVALAKSIDKLFYPVVMPIEALPLEIDNKGTGRAKNFLKPLDIFLNGKNISFGHVNLILDKDGIIRKFPLSVFPLNAFSLEVLKVSKSKIPDEKTLGGVMRIVYSAPSGSIRRIPFWRIFESDSAASLKSKIVFLGATSPDLHDEQLTPFSRGMAMPGVEIQANIANMILSGYRLNSLGSWAMFLWILIAALFTAGIFSAVSNPFKAVLVSIFAGFAHTFMVIFLFDLGAAANIMHINFSWILSALSIFGFRYFSVEKEKRELKNIFSKYVSKDVLNEILDNPEKVKLGGEEKEVTVFFSDIRGFTSISEKTSPKELVRILNRYFTLMTNEILKNNGVLDKYIGDAIMAFWGAPIDDANQAENALKAALGMVEKLKELNKELKVIGDPEINIGIGLYSGPAIVGNVGSDLRFDYTVMGDTVNIASRLEGLNK